MKKIILTLLIGLILIFPIITKAETIDTTPPIISSITAETTEYNIGDAVKLTVDVSDDISGIYFVNVILAPKDDINNLNSLIMIHNSNLKNGVSVITSNINFGVKDGKYVIRMIQVSDWAGNMNYFANDNVEKMPDTNYNPLPFKNVEINVTNKSTDKTAPIISNIKINKNQFNVGEKLIVSMEVTDESDIKSAHLSGDYGWSGFVNTHDNIYQAEILLKKPGTFKFYAIEISDIYNNSGRYLYKSGPEIISKEYNIIEDNLLDITVSGELDEIAPTIKSVEINKKEVKLPSTLEIKVNYTDNKPNDIYRQWIEIYDVKTKEKSKIYCNEGIRPEDYFLTCLINLKQYEELGEYYIGRISLEDGSNNISNYTYEDNTLEYYSFKIIADTNSDSSSSTISDNLDNVIINTKDDAVISIDSTRNNIVKKSIFDNIKGTNKTIVIESDGIQWIFNGKDIKNETKDINVKANISVIDTKTDSALLNKIFDNVKLINISFAPNGLLPGIAKIRVKADYTFRNIVGTKNLYVLYLDESNNTVRYISKLLNMTSDGYYEFYIAHNSKYLITSEKPKETYIETSNTDKEVEKINTSNNNTKEENQDKTNNEDNNKHKPTTGNDLNKVDYKNIENHVFIIILITSLLLIVGSIGFIYYKKKKAKQM